MMVKYKNYRIKSLQDNKSKTQLNAFNALMSNWDKARQYVQEYKDGLTVGSAEKEKFYSPYVK